MPKANYIVQNVDDTGAETSALLLAKLDLVITGLSNIKIEADSINLNTDALETLVAATTTAVNTLRTSILGSGSKDLTTLTIQVDLITTAVNALKTAFELTQAAHGAAASLNVQTIGGRASASAQAPVDEGDEVRAAFWLDGIIKMIGDNITDGVKDIRDTAPANQAVVSIPFWTAQTANQTVVQGCSSSARKTAFLKVITDAAGYVTFSIYGCQDAAGTYDSLLWTKNYPPSFNNTDTVQIDGHFPYIRIVTTGTVAVATTTAILEGRGQ